MNDVDASLHGYVYVLAVKGIDLPVCKVGMTTRSPYARCDEINKSSTGDFLWEVAHHIAVDNCKKLESLFLAKLEPLRQKRREFFNISADDAFTALKSILDQLHDVKRVRVRGRHDGQNRMNGSHPDPRPGMTKLERRDRPQLGRHPGQCMGRGSKQMQG